MCESCAHPTLQSIFFFFSFVRSAYQLATAAEAATIVVVVVVGSIEMYEAFYCSKAFLNSVLFCFW